MKLGIRINGNVMIMHDPEVKGHVAVTKNRKT